MPSHFALPDFSPPQKLISTSTPKCHRTQRHYQKLKNLFDSFLSACKLEQLFSALGPQA
jgi:hypothetical protein